MASDGSPRVSFDAATDWSSDAVDIPEAWMIGRTAFGGLTAAAAARAMRALVPDERPLRSFTAAFAGPTGARATVSAQTTRTGKSMTFARAEIEGERGPAMHALAAYGAPRSSSVVRSPAVPTDQRGPEGLPSLPFLSGVVPNFVQHFDLRWADGAFPFSGNAELDHAGWCRHRTVPGPPEAALLALLDAWPSPALQTLSAPAPANTATWTANFLHVPQHITTEDWFWYQARVIGAAGDGFLTMRAELFDSAGRMLAHLEQLVAVFDVSGGG